MKELTVKGFKAFVFPFDNGNLIEVVHEYPSANMRVLFNKHKFSSILHYKKENTVVLKVDNSLKIKFTEIEDGFFEHLLHLLK